MDDDEVMGEVAIRNMAVLARRIIPRLSGFRLQDEPLGSVIVVEPKNVCSSTNAVAVATNGCSLWMASRRCDRRRRV